MINKPQLSLVTTAQALAGGVDALQGIGEDYLVNFGSAYNVLTFNQGDKITLELTDQGTGYQTQVGAGYVAGVGLTFCLTYNNKVYGLADGTMYCTAVSQPTIWNDPNAVGNGFITMSNWYASSESLISMAPFQGKLAFLSRNTTQIWGVDPNLDNWQLVQVLQNVGTRAKDSVQGLGELDVLFLNDSGIRSLCVRYADLNATSNDVGSPVDNFVQSLLSALTDAQVEASCSVIEPSQSRYWCAIQVPATVIDLSAFTYDNTGVFNFDTLPYATNRFAFVAGANDTSVDFYTPNQVDGGNLDASAGASTLVFYGTPMASVTAILTLINPSVIFVLSYFPSNKIIAWSKYLATDSDGLPFVPVKFVVYNGQVYATDGINYYLYGGANGMTYDSTLATIQIPFYDEKRPGHKKHGLAVDVDVTGEWTVYGSPDWINDSFQTVGATAGIATFDNGVVGYEDVGSHFSFKLTTVSAIPASVAAILFYYNLAEENS